MHLLLWEQFENGASSTVSEDFDLAATRDRSDDTSYCGTSRFMRLGRNTTALPSPNIQKVLCATARFRQPRERLLAVQKCISILSLPLNFFRLFFFHCRCRRLASDESVKEMLEVTHRKCHQGSIGTGAPFSSPSSGAPCPVNSGSTAIMWSRHAAKHPRQSWGNTDKHAMCEVNLPSASRS